MSSQVFLSIHLLGSFKVQFGDKVPTLRRKTRATLGYLAATNQVHHRQALADMFCQETKNPARSLRSLLSRIRRNLSAEALLTEGETVRFNRDVGWVDCVQFEQVLSADLTEQALDRLAEAVDLYRGEFLEGLHLANAPEFELWLLGERTRMRQLYERGLAGLMTGLIAQGQYEPATLRAQQLVQSNALLEEAHARLILLYAQSGQREAALEQFEQCRELLERELAVEPTPELQALYEQVHSGQVGRAILAAAVTSDVSQERQELIQAPDFVGREKEMAQLRQVWHAARRGRGRVVLLESEAGGGKSRLVDEFVVTVPEAPFLVGECYESTAALPYRPWIEVLETQLATLSDSTLRRLSPFWLDYLMRLLPSLAGRLGRALPPAPPTSGGEAQRLFSAISELLFLPVPPSELGGARGGRLIFIDNLQWADEASLRLFHFVARKVPRSKALLIGTFRSEEVEDTPALQTLLRDLRRHRPLYFHLRLAPLTAENVNTLTSQLWSTLPKGYRTHVSLMLTTQTGGNPLFVTEVLQELAHTTEVPQALPVPESVRDLISHRLRRLPESGRQVIEALAVLDTPATLPEAQQTGARSAEETINAIDLGLRRGLLSPQKESYPTRYDFKHDLVREAVLSQLSFIRRQLLHRRAGVMLEQHGASAATLVYHWGMAGERMKEGHYALLAGQQAAAIYANDEAIRYLSRALPLLTEPNRQLDVMRSLGEVWYLLGNWSEAEAIYRQALHIAERIDQKPTQAECQAALGRLMRIQGLYDEALRWLSQAEVAYDRLQDQAGKSQVMGQLGALHWCQLDYPRALSCFFEQLDLGRQLGDRQQVALAVGSLGVVYNEQGDYARAMDYYLQRLKIDQELGDPLSQAKTIGNMAAVYQGQGEYARALACLTQLLQVTLQREDRHNVSVAVGNMINTHSAQGRYHTAERHKRRS